MYFRVSVYQILRLREQNNLNRQEGEGRKARRAPGWLRVRCIGRRKVRACDGRRAASLAWIALVSQPLVRSRLNWKRDNFDHWMQKHCNATAVAAQLRLTSLFGSKGDLLLENDEGAWVLQLENITEEEDHTDGQRFTDLDCYLWRGQFYPNDPTDVFRALRNPEGN